ncbi:MAG TPA: hypothetical protein VIE12_04425 [Actinomycetota bacterium]
MLEEEDVHMDRTTRDRLVDRYREGPQVVSEALEGITPAELDARPGRGVVGRSRDRALS